ncbi:hypothetical protein [Glutamicibacter arilaitensis]|uniref:hypothetical protein n=1 Tax=Glutamicibacter arilaitensis TaxID=256701 RepID=UPI003FD0D0EF
MLSFDGWFDSPERKSRDEARDDDDGDFEAEDFYQSRMISIEGRLKTRNHEMLHEAAGRISSLLHRGPGLLHVGGHGVAQSATVKLAGAVRCKAAPGTDDYLNWQLRLKAIDPYKYGEKRDYQGSVGSHFDVFHRGTVPAWPLITVSGSMPGGYEVMLAGNLIEVTRSLTAGETHTIDTRTGLLRVNGAVVSGGLGTNEMFRIQAGTTQSLYSVPRTTGSGTVKIDVTDTYI